MLVTKREIKTISKKGLSLLLAVIMIMTSMSVCFGTVSFAAGGTATDAQWNALANALANDTVKGAEFSGSTNNYTVEDPDGKVLAAVEAYWSVFTTLANTAPATGNPNNTTNSTGSSEGNRTINQVNDTIKSTLSSKMGTDYTTYNVATFLTKLISGASVSAGTGSKRAVGPSSSNDKTVLGTDLGTVADVNLTVISENAITGSATIDELPESVVTSKTFTVKHTNSNYDYTYATEVRQEPQGSGCTAQTVDVTYYTRTYAYFYNISECSTKNGDSISTQIIKDAGATLEANEAYFNESLYNLVYNYSADTLTTVSNAVSTAKKNVVDNFGAGVFTHFFSGYAVDTLVQDIATAKEIQNVGPYAVDLMNKVEAGYADIIDNKGELNTLLSGINTDLAVYNAASLSAKTFINNNGYDAAAVETLRNGVIRAIELIELRELLEKVVADMLVYSQYDEAGIDEGTVTTAMIGAAITKITTHQSDLSKYQVADIDEITETTNFLGTITDLKNQLNVLASVAGYNDRFAARYATFAGEIFSVTDANGDIAVLLEALQNYDSWYTGLKALINEMRTELGDELADALFDDLNDVMTARMDDAYLALNTTVEAQINAAYDLFTAYVNAYGEKVNMATVSEYRAMKNSIGLINVDAYNFLKGTTNFDISDDAVAKYDAMQKQFPQYDSFLSSHGFSTFETNTIEDLVRPDTDEDIARENEGGIYKATDAQVEKIIELLDAALQNEEVKKLLGDLINKDEDGNPTGEPFALGALIENLLDESVFTDSLINTIIQFVYPLVAKEFAKVWAGLPATMTIEDVDTGFLGIKADVTADLSLDDVETAIASVGVFLAPSTLAKNLENAYGKNSGEYAKYTEVISVLKSATTKAVYSLNGDGDEDDTFVNPWEDPNLFENVYDEVTGEQVFNDDGTPKQVYKLNWGVDEAEDKRAAFIDAACAALSGLEPLLFGILTNSTQANANDSDATPRGAKIGTGSGSAQVIISLNLEIDPITLVLKFGGNDGYDNALAPIFEALGLTNIPHGEDLTTTRKILEDGLFAMIDQLIAKLDEAPVTFLLEALPNLAYALEGGLVEPLLGMLRTEINYYADAQYSVIGLLNGSMPDAMKSEKPIIVDLGEMINLQDMGLDISSFQAIWNMIAGGVELLAGLDAPNAGYIATLGNLVEKNTNRSAKTYTGGTAGKAYYIEAKKADVLIYLIQYVLNSGLIEGLLTEPNEIIDGILANVNENPDVVLAAVIELLNLGKYDTLEDYTWYEGEVDENGTVSLTPAMIEYLAYDNDWTKEKATYLIENIDAIITAVLAMVNKDKAEDETVSFDLGAMIGELLGGVFTNKNITAIAGLLSQLDINALLAGGDEEAEEGEEAITPDTPETVEEGEDATEETEAPAIDVAALLKALTGLDFSAFADYKELAEDTTWGFEDGDAEGFVTALVTILEPLKPVLDFILADADLEIALSADDKVTLVGYNGYDSAIVPLLEALGCDVATLGENDDALTLILNALVAKINAIVADPIDEILNLIPGVLYFIQSNGLATAVRNLLQPIYVILDTIRPIYDLDIAELLAGIEINGQPLSINLDDLGWNFILNDLLPNFLQLDLSGLSTVIADVCKVLGVEYTSASSVIGEDGKKGAYNESFDAADLITVIVSFLLDWAQEDGNAEDLAALIGGDDADKQAEIYGYITGAFNVIKGIDPVYGTIDWAYNFPEGFDESIYTGGISIAPTISSLTYPTDWTEETAKYISDNLDKIIAEVLELAGVEGTLSDMLKENINIFNAKTLSDLIALIAELLTEIDAVLVETVGVALGVDIDAIVNYEASEDIDTAEEFFAALADVLSNIQRVTDWLFFGEDFALFNKGTGEDAIVLKGTEGYAYGLAPILEALGVAAPAKDEATVANVLDAIADRYEEIIADPVNEIFEILPNIIYFLNANGVSVSVKNLLAGVLGLMDAVKVNFGVELDLMKIVNDALNGLLPEDSDVVIDANNLDLETILKLVEALLGLDLSMASDMLADFCVGKIEPFTAVSGEYGFRMVYTDDFARYDMITILVTVALMIVDNDQNAAALDKLIGKEIMGAIRTIFAGGTIEYTTPDWNYPLADNGTVDTMKYAITYPNNWTEETAKYVADLIVSEDFDKLIAGLIEGGKYATVSDLLKDKVNVFTTANLESLLGLITDLLGDIDDTLLGVGMILDVDLVGLKKHEVPANITTVDAFAAELANILVTYAPGVIEWLLLGEDFNFFVDETKMAEGVVYDADKAIITITGADGYTEGLALLLEALGVNAPAVIYNDEGAVDTKATVDAVFAALAARINEIFADPVVEVVELLPNILYFLNTNGIAAVIDNLTAAIMTIVNKLGAFDVNLDINELVNLKKLMKIEDTDATISIDNLAMADILQAVSYMTGLDLTVAEEVLVGFALGQVNEYDSVSANVGTPKKMTYKDEFDKHDMVTVLANIVLLTLADEDNAEFVKGLVGEDIYKVIIALFNMEEVPVQEFNWALIDKADTGEVFSALSSSELYSGHEYGPLYTEEMAQYVADNFGDFVDDIIYLLGIQIEGKNVDTLKELINGLINGNLYNSANVIAIRDALAGVLAGIGNLEVNGTNVGKYITEVLKVAGVADLAAVAEVEVPEFTEDREQFVTYLCDVLEPLYPVLKYVLADEDISFFVDLDKKDAISLKGAEGYAYGIIPLLEVLECEGILTPAEYYAAVEANGDVLLTSILTPLLNRVDEILKDDPAQEILDMLPNLIYFINSNGVDTVVKNTLNAVYTLLSAIEPIAKIDLYELIGIDLSTIDFDWLFDKALELIANATGYEFSAIDANAITELTVGKLESYTSANGKTAYKIVYASADEVNGGNKAEMVTVVMRLLVTFIMHENNQEMLLGLLRDNLGMTADAEKYVGALLKVIADCAVETRLGMDTALATIYYIFYGVDTGVDNTATGVKDLNAEWTKLLKEMRESTDEGKKLAGDIIAGILDLDIFDDIIDPDEGIAPNGFLKFFQKIADFFNRIIEWFKNLFN